MGYDLRGGTGAAFALGSQGQHPVILEVVLRQALMQLPELEQQTSIMRSAVQAINLDPMDCNRLAFHLASGWSGTICTARVPIAAHNHMNRGKVLVSQDVDDTHASNSNALQDALVYGDRGVVP